MNESQMLILLALLLDRFCFFHLPSMGWPGLSLAGASPDDLEEIYEKLNSTQLHVGHEHLFNLLV